jgi:Concanavalin A-like lectin/glucanases superfamily
MLLTIPLSASAQTGETTTTTSTTTGNPTTSLVETSTTVSGPTTTGSSPTTGVDVTTTASTSLVTSSTSSSSTTSTSTSTTTTIASSPVSGALLHWGLNEASGVIASDDAGTSPGTISPGSLLGAPSYTAAHGTAVVGKISGTRPASIVAGGPVSLEFWSKGAGTQGWLGRVGHFGVYRTTRCCNPQTVTLQFAPGVFSQVDLGGSGINLDAGNWHHYVVTHDGVNAGKLYIDGVLYLTGTAPWVASDSTVTVGEATSRTYDDVSVFGATLTPAQVRQRFSEGQLVSPCLTAVPSAYVNALVNDGAVGLWRLDSGPVASDIVGCRNGSYGDGATFEQGVVAEDTNAALRSGGAMRAYVGDVMAPTNPVTLEFWSKGGGFARMDWSNRPFWCVPDYPLL